MSTNVRFNGRNIIEPGAYAAMVYSPTSVVNVAQFGNVMIIDTGISKDGDYEFSGGSGINGELNSGIKSVYEFTDLESFNAFIGGGVLSALAEKIFNPLDGVKGAPKLYYARAATTVAAKIVLTASAGNTVTLTCKNEGVCGNGVADSGILKLGYAAVISAGVTANTFICKVLRGTYQGVDSYGDLYGTKNMDDALPEVIDESEELTTLADLFNFLKNSKDITALFDVALVGVDTTPLTAVAQTLATGGTTTFLGTTDYSDVLEAITELDITFHLCTDFGVTDGVTADTNGKLFTAIKQETKFTQFMFIGGGEADDDLLGVSGSSQAIAKYFNSEQVIVVHGAPVVAKKSSYGTKNLSSLYLAAAVVGLNAGAEPQMPLTFKRIGYQSFVYDLKKKEREAALQAGIMHVRNISGYWCINQGITSLQDNKQTYALDGQTIELSIALIKAQINKELVIEGEKRFIGNTAAQANPVSVKNFTETKLASFVAEPGKDNLLISWKNVKVTGENGDYHTTYDLIPNVPVNKTFWVGNVLDYKF